MRATSGALQLAAVVIAALAATASATNYTVGGPDGWDTFIDYDKWLAGKIFMVGDFITFNYMPYHNVLEVTEADYATCASDSPLSTHSGGNTTFALKATGTRYFICGIPRHCLNGTMHVKVTTVPYAAAAAAAAANGPSPAPLPSSPADSLAPAPAGYKVAPSSAPRFQQPAAAVAGLALAALLALAV